MTRVLETSTRKLELDAFALPVAPMAMPEQVLERPRLRGALFATLLKRLVVRS
ncbi:hypothetical protein [Nitratireductor sp. ZSWI3]|uniref:hypothetical protein n=1 Tax=Nitratireductor sp. ZSWI3 TaxID=2966359 RepID=UPI002150561A|nr:hypothetical protein [Nitratireductor sp. ZSWI3]MCR4268329.1 hypothetical protein [Nitratireductor sp. ZSWI3]